MPVGSRYLYQGTVHSYRYLWYVFELSILSVRILVEFDACYVILENPVEHLKDSPRIRYLYLGVLCFNSAIFIFSTCTTDVPEIHETKKATM
jgi:hypothetical protein